MQHKVRLSTSQPQNLSVWGWTWIFMNFCIKPCCSHNWNSVSFGENIARFHSYRFVLNIHDWMNGSMEQNADTRSNCIFSKQIDKKLLLFLRNEENEENNEIHHSMAIALRKRIIYRFGSFWCAYQEQFFGTRIYVGWNSSELLMSNGNSSNYFSKGNMIWTVFFFSFLMCSYPKQTVVVYLN